MNIEKKKLDKSPPQKELSHTEVGQSHRKQTLGIEAQTNGYRALIVKLWCDVQHSSHL